MEKVEVKQPKELHWENLPDSEAQFAVLAGDTTQETFFVVRIKFPPNYSISPHHHLNYEYDTIIEGKCYIAMGATFDKSKGIPNTAGNFVVIPPHLPHYGWTEDEGAIIQVSGIGPWGPIYEEDEGNY